jgi:NADPH-dependent curcumin reductase CurA
MKRRTTVLTSDDYQIAEVDLPALGEGQVLARVLMFALDPYLSRSMQTWVGETPAWGDGTIHGRLLAEVLESQASSLKPGDLIAGLGRWQEYEIFDARRVQYIDDGLTPPSLALGVLSGSGLTAWLGLRVAELVAGETIFISAATGTVGSVAGQLAKQRGARVIGLAGGEAKCRHAVEVLGFDACVDHRAADPEGQIASAAPDGIDVMFENVGAPSMDAALPSMTFRGRILLCGLAAHYNSDRPATFRNLAVLLFKQISVTPLAISAHAGLLSQARRELYDEIAAGSLVYDETVVDGFENAPSAYLDMLAGVGLGKRLLRIAGADEHRRPG